MAIVATFFITKFATNQDCCSTKKDEFKEITDEIPETAEVYRLPTNVLPINYNIKLQPFILDTHFNYTGSIEILIECKESTNLIELNAAGLDIHLNEMKIHEDDHTKTGFKVTKHVYKDEVLKLELDRKLNANKNYIIYMPFTGKITNSLVGFYRSSYFDSDKKETR